MDVNNPVTFTDEELKEALVEKFSLETHPSNMYKRFKSLVVLPDGTILNNFPDFTVGMVYGIFYEKDPTFMELMQSGIYREDALKYTKIIVLHEDRIESHHKQFTKEQNASLLLLKKEGIINYPVFYPNDLEKEDMCTRLLTSLHKNGDVKYTLVEPGNGGMYVTDDNGKRIGTPVFEPSAPTLWALKPLEEGD